MDIVSARSWNSYVTLSPMSIRQLSFWEENLSAINVNHFDVSYGCHKIVYSDASSTGFAGFCVQSRDRFVHDMWVGDEVMKSSTWRELAAVDRVMTQLVGTLQGQRVKWFTDNQSVEKIVRKGSMKQDLQEMALHIFSVCLRNNIRLEIDWIPRALIERSDYLSKIVDHDDWSVSDALFRYVESVWGPYDLDRFASYYNAKVGRFCSRFWNPNAFAIDAFSIDWNGYNLWIVPPVHIIARAILYLAQCQGYRTLIVPVWPSASFWPILHSDRISQFVRGCFDLPTSKSCYVAGKINSGLFGTADLKFRMLAILLDCI